MRAFFVRRIVHHAAEHDDRVRPPAGRAAGARPHPHRSASPRSWRRGDRAKRLAFLLRDDERRDRVTRGLALETLRAFAPRGRRPTNEATTSPPRALPTSPNRRPPCRARTARRGADGSSARRAMPEQYASTTDGARSRRRRPIGRGVSDRRRRACVCVSGRRVGKAARALRERLRARGTRTIVEPSSATCFRSSRATPPRRRARATTRSTSAQRRISAQQVIGAHAIAAIGRVGQPVREKQDAHARGRITTAGTPAATTASGIAFGHDRAGADDRVRPDVGHDDRGAADPGAGADP